MDKMPCHITSEVINNDPQDAPDAVDKEYDVTISIKALLNVVVTAESEHAAIIEAKLRAHRNIDIIDIEFYDDAEVIEQ